VKISLATLPARPDRPNEDFAAVAPGAAVLLDGAGMPAATPIGCVHGVAWFAGTLGALLLRTIVGEPDRSLTDCLAAAIAETRSMHGGRCDLDHAASPSSTVVAVRVRHGVLEYAVLGDSSLVLADQAGEPTVITDRRLDAVGRRHRGALDELPTGSPEHTRALKAYRDALTLLRNRPGGYWIASTEPEAAHHALTGSAPVGTLASVNLLSDGASRLVDRFDLANWREAVALVASSGPEALVERVREAESTDPDGQRWPRSKSSDDATVIRWPF
jgi:hypothetical protein